MRSINFDLYEKFIQEGNELEVKVYRYKKNKFEIEPKRLEFLKAATE